MAGIREHLGVETFKRALHKVEEIGVDEEERLEGHGERPLLSPLKDAPQPQATRPALAADGLGL